MQTLTSSSDEAGRGVPKIRQDNAHMLTDMQDLNLAVLWFLTKIRSRKT